MDLSFNFANIRELEALYENFLQAPESVDPSFRAFFEGMQLGASLTKTPSGDNSALRIYLLITAYRLFGHTAAHCNPLGAKTSSPVPELSLSHLHFTIDELSASFPTCGLLKKESAPLREIIGTLEAIYCNQIGFECMGLGNPDLEKWIQSQIEPSFLPQILPKEKISLLEQLTLAESFENLLHTRYPGQKRFSLEGEETLVPLLNTLIAHASSLGAEEFPLGMSHRGRLNVQANVLGKPYGSIFREFEDQNPSTLSSGDVKYHLGFSAKIQGTLISLIANPSHLESVNPVVLGVARARQELHPKKTQGICPILIHGDGSISGQGVVYETMQLHQLKGYATGGTIHIVVNNQIGFTTPPKDGRSTLYCTQIAKTFSAPVFHVNAEDVEGCIQVAKLASQIRMQFGCDVFIDLNGYRKYGHNEGDEPLFTQPVEYSQIQQRPSIREKFCSQLLEQGVLTPQAAQELELGCKRKIQDPFIPPTSPTVSRTPLIPTSVNLQELAALSFLPQKKMKLHPKLERLLEGRRTLSMVDWAVAEILAYASLVTQGVHVRISGEDVRRGTFSHRHAVLFDQETGVGYSPLANLSSTQAPFTIYNSPLSEFAVLGFEFGYSTAYPHSLVIWEAQFGDFANEAQVIIDQYICSSEQKWNLSTNLTLFLPHGYEGQGPEHSSARMERFLQLCAHANLRIVNPSTPAQFFHLLRAQAFLQPNKPLIAFTPKAILRHPSCLSKPEELSSGSFVPILSELCEGKTEILFCSGKIFYDLVLERQNRDAHHYAIIRIEQLYPFPEEELRALRLQLPWCWVQEEPANMGAWSYIAPHLKKLLGTEGRYAGRKAEASPAAGSTALHKQQTIQLMDHAFNR